MFAIDFGAHWPQKGHKMLLETGPTGQTGVMKLQEVSGLIFPTPTRDAHKVPEVPALLGRCSNTQGLPKYRHKVLK